jgi:septal ring-binding cell division protein DamX
MSFGTQATPQYVALARLFENDELKALIQFHGTSQRYFYTVTRFERGVWTEVAGQFRSLEEAKTASAKLSAILM